MKRLLSFISVCAFLLTANAESDAVAFVWDGTGTPTNLRESPRGKVVMSLADTCSYIVGISAPINGWWQVDWVEAAEEANSIELTGSPNGKYYIHYSVLGFGTRNYGSQKLYLRARPSAMSKVKYSFKDERILRPMETKGDWVKVRTEDKKHEGWIEWHWICANPLTTCP